MYRNLQLVKMKRTAVSMVPSTSSYSYTQGLYLQLEECEKRILKKLLRPEEQGICCEVVYPMHDREAGT